MVDGTGIFNGLAVPCNCYDNEFSCCCSPDERVLRAYIDGLEGLPAMTQVQRTECVADIVRCHEGEEAKDWEGASDKDLAGGVLHAWLVFARDKGVL